MMISLDSHILFPNGEAGEKRLHARSKLLAKKKVVEETIISIEERLSILKFEI